MIKLRELINAILIFLISVIMMMILIFVVSKFILKNNLPSVFGYSILRIDNNDMYPTLEAGDLIIIKDGYNYQIDDIVVKIDNEGKPVTQRIIEIDETNVLTKADNIEEFDEIKDVNSIQGKVIYVFPKFFRYIKLWHIIITLMIFSFIDVLLNYLVLNNSRKEIRRW